MSGLRDHGEPRSKQRGIRIQIRGIPFELDHSSLNLLLHSEYSKSERHMFQNVATPKCSVVAIGSNTAMTTSHPHNSHSTEPCDSDAPIPVTMTGSHRMTSPVGTAGMVIRTQNDTNNTLCTRVRVEMNSFVPGKSMSVLSLSENTYLSLKKEIKLMEQRCTAQLIKATLHTT